MVLANPIIIELDMGKLEDLLERIDTQDLCAEDYATIHSVIESYIAGAVLCGGQQRPDHRATAEDSLRRTKTEKTAMVVGQHPPEKWYSGGGACGIAWGRCSRRKMP